MTSDRSPTAGAGPTRRLSPIRDLESLVLDRIGAAWERGWMPTDLVRAATRRLDARAADLCRALVLAEHARRGPTSLAPRWREQIDAMSPTSGAPPAAATGPGRSPLLQLALSEGPSHAAELGSALSRSISSLPDLPFICAPPGHHDHRHRGDAHPVGGTGQDRLAGTVDPALLQRIRNLLAKAESTDFEHEAAAFTAKAQQLMTTNSVREAMLSHIRDRSAGSGDRPTAVRIVVDDPYARPKSLLVGVVARANRCRAVWHSDLGFSTVFGYALDLRSVEILHTSLLVQATRAMTAHGPQRDARGRSRTRSFRRSFITGYAGRIGQRLDRAAHSSAARSRLTYGDALLPVLTSRESRVEQALDEAFPGLRTGRVTMSNPAGYRAGVLAADLAHLGPTDSLAS